MRRALTTLRNAVALFAVVTLLAPAAFAFPSSMAVEGVLLAGSGTPAADGAYKLTFTLYPDAKSTTALWSEGPASVTVAQGRFSYALGSAKALPPSVLAGSNPWLEISVGTDKLPRQPLRAVAYAMVAAEAQKLTCSGCISAAQLAAGSVPASRVGFTYAGSTTKGGPAKDLACTACVSVKELKFDGDVDLGGNSLKAKNGTFTGNLAAGTVTATSFVGDGSKLTGIPHAAGTCKADEAIVGIAADGSVKCAAVGAGSNKALAGMISSELPETADISPLPVAIPDNQGTEAIANATFGKVGLATGIKVHVELSNSDLAGVRVKLLPPDDKAKGLTICDPCGKKDAKALKLDLTEKSALKVGSLSTYIGKPMKGTWNLKVLDSVFCVPQAPGNAALCDINKKTDGAIKAFAINATVNSSISITTPGSIRVGPFAAAPFACKASKVGHLYFDNTARVMRYCDGVAWRNLEGRCGNGLLEPGEACDDGNVNDGDGCTSQCKVMAEKTCAAIKAKNKNAKTGWYTIDIDGPKALPAVRVVCDMTTDGGGWTRFMYHSDPDGHTQISKADWDAGINLAANGQITQWMVKTYLEPNQDTAKKSAFANAWKMYVNKSYQRAAFDHFRHHRRLSYSQHRWNGPGYIDKAVLLPGSECKAWHGSYNQGRYLWGEHTWTNDAVGWMWMSHCGSPVSAHLLIVNHDHPYPAGRGQTLVGTTKSKGGTHSNYDEDGASFEFFFR